MESTYTESKRKYYEENREKIAEKEKVAKRWKSYYEKNKDAVKARNLTRYYARIGKPMPPPKPPQPPLPEDAPPLEDVKALIKQLQSLLPALRKVERKKRRTEADSPVITTEVLTTE
jgi:1-acyl-sn-glycerol-3-phosphate acyltransferase